MVDVVSPSVRSRMMSGIRGKDTKPEHIIRKGLHARGLRFRIHVKDLPGKPDLLFPKYQAVVMVNGCFWHGHDCGLFKWPTTRTEFWRVKIEQNRKRDIRHLSALNELGWRVCVVWECALRGSGKDIEKICNDLFGWLKSTSPYLEIKK